MAKCVDTDMMDQECIDGTCAGECLWTLKEDGTRDHLTCITDKTSGKR